MFLLKFKMDHFFGGRSDDLSKVYYFFINEKKRFDSDGIISNADHSDFRKMLECRISA